MPAVEMSKSTMHHPHTRKEGTVDVHPQLWHCHSPMTLLVQFAAHTSHSFVRFLGCNCPIKFEFSFPLLCGQRCCHCRWKYLRSSLELCCSLCASSDQSIKRGWLMWQQVRVVLHGCDDSGRNHHKRGQHVFNDNEFSESSICINFLHFAVAHRLLVWFLAFVGDGRGRHCESCHCCLC